MKTLPEPPFSSLEVLNACANSVQSYDFAKRIRDAIPTVGVAEAEYCDLGKAGELYEIVADDGLTGQISAAEMRRLYTGTLSKKGSAVRHYYDAIRVAARNGVCPLCNQRAVKTLDHYLSKDTHPRLAVTPANLVPACSDCNKEKLNKLAKGEAEQTLHPYFDDLGDTQWLAAQVIKSSPPSVMYFASPPEGIPLVLQERIRSHFETFRLAELYSIQAAVELVNIRFWLQELHQVEGAAGVQKFLIQQAKSRCKADANSWGSALYVALAGSDWYCDVGFSLAI